MLYSTEWSYSISYSLKLIHLALTDAFVPDFEHTLRCEQRYYRRPIDMSAAEADEFYLTAGAAQWKEKLITTEDVRLFC